MTSKVVLAFSALSYQQFAEGTEEAEAFKATYAMSSLASLAKGRGKKQSQHSNSAVKSRI
jgi:hypothetical protein